MHLAVKHPDELHFGLSGSMETVKPEDIPKEYIDPETGDTTRHWEILSSRMDFKYMITIDGHIAPWGRGPQILYRTVF